MINGFKTRHSDIDGEQLEMRVALLCLIGYPRRQGGGVPLTAKPAVIDLQADKKVTGDRSSCGRLNNLAAAKEEIGFQVDRQ